MVAEDNEVNRRILSAMLTKQGALVDFAADGELGLAAVKAEDYDLIFMDCQMPIMDGYECTRQIRQFEEGSGNHRKIVATTANAMSSDQEDCLKSGMDDYIAKPVTAKALAAVIERVLDN